jgi:hypothetical protein
VAAEGTDTQAAAADAADDGEHAATEVGLYKLNPVVNP